MKKTPPEDVPANIFFLLDLIAAKALSYKLKPKTKAAKRRKRKAQRDAKKG
jgi:hypothetical protein